MHHGDFATQDNHGHGFKSVAGWLFIRLQCRLKMHSQTDDQTEIVRLGLNKVLANLWIRDAVPDARNIEREAFVEVN